MSPAEQTEFIAATLKHPATMALIRLEGHKTDIPLLRETREAEVTGKARWQVLNQLRMWAAESGAKI